MGLLRELPHGFSVFCLVGSVHLPDQSPGSAVMSLLWFS